MSSDCTQVCWTTNWNPASSVLNWTSSAMLRTPVSNAVSIATCRESSGRELGMSAMRMAPTMGTKTSAGRIGNELDPSEARTPDRTVESIVALIRSSPAS